MTHDAKTPSSETRDDRSAPYQMRLFVAGDETNSAIARVELSRICEEHLKADCHIEVIDVLKDFRPALQENILVTPALIVERATLRTVIFGNLTDKEKVLAALRIGGMES